MKTTLTLALASLALAACGTATTASHVKSGDQESVEVQCDSNDRGADYGQSVEITSGGLAGLTMAKVDESWIGGVRRIATVAVTRHERGDELRYTGRNFSLTIALESFAPTTHHQGELVLTKNGHRTTTEVTCTVN